MATVLTDIVSVDKVYVYFDAPSATLCTIAGSFNPSNSTVRRTIRS